MANKPAFKPFRINRSTRETVFSISFSPRRAAGRFADLPNRLLGHMLDHMLKACGVSIEIAELAWPGSWQFDHVLCEDMGQIVGCGAMHIHHQLQASSGVAGRASATACMDESLVSCTISFEGRPRCEWIIPPNESIDGFVDAWFDERGNMIGQAHGTNLCQFFDGFAIGARATVAVEVRKAGNLHHTFEAAFRAFGDALGEALGLGLTTARLPGDSSGFAGAARYEVEQLEGSPK